MSCPKCPSPNESPSIPESVDKRSNHALSKFIPEGSALLSCSCCWLPTVLDFFFAGSMTAVLHQAQPVFLAISILSLVWSIAREGLSGSNIRRVLICGTLLAWSQYKGYAVQGEEHHSCH